MIYDFSFIECVDIGVFVRSKAGSSIRVGSIVLFQLANDLNERSDIFEIQDFVSKSLNPLNE